MWCLFELSCSNKRLEITLSGEQLSAFHDTLRKEAERIVASLVAMDAAVGMQERAHAAYATFVGVTEPLVSRQDELDRELLAALASLEQAAGQAGLGASLGKVVGEGMGAIVEAADELAAAHLTPLH